MIKRLHLFLLSFYGVMVLGQEQIQYLKGIVENESTGFPMESVHILNLNMVEGTTTDKKGNFEIQVPEIDQDVMEDGAVFAFIERAATDDRPQRWSQFPQYNLIWKEIGDTTFSYLSYGEGFVRISLQSEISVEGVAKTFKGLKLKLVILD